MVTMHVGMDIEIEIARGIDDMTAGWWYYLLGVTVVPQRSHVRYVHEYDLRIVDAKERPRQYVLRGEVVPVELPMVVHILRVA